MYNWFFVNLLTFLSPRVPVHMGGMAKKVDFGLQCPFNLSVSLADWLTDSLIPLLKVKVCPSSDIWPAKYQKAYKIWTSMWVHGRGLWKVCHFFVVVQSLVVWHGKQQWVQCENLLRPYGTQITLSCPDDSRLSKVWQGTNALPICMTLAFNPASLGKSVPWWPLPLTQLDTFSKGTPQKATLNIHTYIQTDRQSYTFKFQLKSLYLGALEPEPWYCHT